MVFLKIPSRTVEKAVPDPAEKSTLLQSQPRDQRDLAVKKCLASYPLPRFCRGCGIVTSPSAVLQLYGRASTGFFVG